MIYSFIYIISLVHVASFMSGPRAGNMMRRLSFSQHAQQGLLQAAETRSALYPVLGRSRYALRLQAKKSEEEDSKPKAVKKAAVVKKAPKEKVEKVEKATAKVVEVEVEAAEAPKKKALKAKKGEETVEPAKKVVKAKGPKAKPPVKGKLDEEAQGAKLGGLDFDALLGENFDFSAEGIARLGLLPNLDEDLAELEANLGELGLGEDFSFLDDDGADDPLAGLDLNDDILKQLQALGAKGTKKGAKLGKKGKGKAAELDQDLDLELGEADFSMDELMKMVEEEEEEPVVKAKKTKPAVRKPAPQKEEKEEEEEDDDDDFSSQAMRRMKLAHDDDDLGLDVIIKDDEDEEDDEDLDIEEEPKKKKKPPARTSRAFTPVDLDLDMDLDDDDGPITLATSAEIVAKGLNARGRKASKAGGKKLRKGLSAEEDLELGIVDPPPVEEFKRLMESLGPDSMFEESSTDQFFEEDMEPATKKKRGRKRASVEDGEEEEEVGEDDGASILDDMTMGGTVGGDAGTMRRARQQADDEQFPDEVDTPDDIPARQRFARYRALQSFRASPWHAQENLPTEYARLFQFENFAGTQRRLLAESLAAEKLQAVSALAGRASQKGSQRGSQRGSVLSAQDRDAMDDEEEEGPRGSGGGSVAGSAAPSLASALTVQDSEGFLAAGQFVCLELEKVPMAVAGRLAGRGFLLCCGLYRHEQKLSVLHFGLTKHSACVETIKSKDELLFVAGFRSFIGRPAFSESNLNCDKHKFERFLLPDRFCVASVFGPVCVPATPLLVFRRAGPAPLPDDATHATAGLGLGLGGGSVAGVCDESRGSGAGWELVATGSLMSVDPDRITLKKIILTGFPIRVRKKFAVVKHLFHHPSDARWFKPAELVTKWGLRGHITEPVGTHGLLKAQFSGAIAQNDTVMLILYKRVYPKFPPQGVQLM
mmetsp:Transcript_5832/g.12863  ORF Transcript_5832/g.12863 Transcript_5832/m.12863 type:complete len:934 (+) Transcript_5832:171-2972(+)